MKKGQLELAQSIILGLVITGTFAVVGFKINAGLRSGETADSIVDNATDAVDTAYNEVVNNLDLVALVGIFTIVISLVLVMRARSGQ
jgi:hypothetical protein